MRPAQLPFNSRLGHLGIISWIISGEDLRTIVGDAESFAPQGDALTVFCFFFPPCPLFSGHMRAIMYRPSLPSPSPLYYPFPQSTHVQCPHRDLMSKGDGIPSVLRHMNGYEYVVTFTCPAWGELGLDGPCHGDGAKVQLRL